MKKKNYDNRIEKYLAGELSPNEMIELEKELSLNPKNKGILSVLKQFRSEEKTNIPEPSPFMKTRLNARLEKANAKSNPFAFLIKPVQIPSFVLILIFLLILTLAIGTVRNKIRTPEEVYITYETVAEENSNGYFGTYDSSADDSFYNAYYETLATLK